MRAKWRYSSVRAHTVCGLQRQAHGVIPQSRGNTIFSRGSCVFEASFSAPKDRQPGTFLVVIMPERHGSDVKLKKLYHLEAGNGTVYLKQSKQQNC